MPVVSDYTALLSGYYWNSAGTPVARPIVLTYTFLKAPPPYGQNFSAPSSTFSPLTEYEKQAVKSALAAWSAVAGITFIEATSAIGDLAFANYALAAPAAGAAGPPVSGFYLDSSGMLSVSQATSGAMGGDIAFIPDVTNYPIANITHVALHEIGHALGLKHPHLEEANSKITLDPLLDTAAHTVMSYNGYDGVLGDLDIAAAQVMYGRSGVSDPTASWTWSATTETFTLISTRAGDLVRGVGAAVNVITAAAGSVVVANGQNLNLITTGDRSTVSTVFGRSEIHSGSDSEVRTGAGNDVVHVGEGAQVFTGEGSDVVHAGASSQVSTGTGNDIVHVGEGAQVSTGDGNDTVYSGSNGQIHTGSGNDVVYSSIHDRVYAGDGNDVVFVSGINFYVESGGGTDVAVVASDKPSQTFGTTVFPAGPNIFIWNGKSTSGADQFWSFTNQSYIEFSNAVFSASKMKYLDDVALGVVRNGYNNIMRLSGDASSHLSIAQLTDSIDSGALAISQAISNFLISARATSSVATLSYQFFTGKVPSAAGMDYLVSPTGPNSNNLNSTYYQNFSTENRYINFAVNLGKDGEGAASFSARYGADTLFDATRHAYATIFGTTPSDAKLHAILDPTFQILGQTVSRADYFAYYGRDGVNGIGTKAAMVGWLLSEAAKADIGTYALSNDAFLTDVALHNAPFAVDLIGHYSQPTFAFG